MAAKISRLRITNYRGIQELDTKVPAAGAIARGANGRGKTSVLRAIRAALAELDEATRTLAAVRAAQTWIQVEDAIKDYDAAAKTSEDSGPASAGPGRSAAGGASCDVRQGRPSHDSHDQTDTGTSIPDDERRDAVTVAIKAHSIDVAVERVLTILREVRAEGERAGWDAAYAEAVSLLKRKGVAVHLLNGIRALAARRPGRQGGGDGGTR